MAGQRARATSSGCSNTFRVHSRPMRAAGCMSPAGGPRVARFTVGQSLRRTDFVELRAPTLLPMRPSPSRTGRLHFIVPADGSFEIRSYPIR